MALRVPTLREGSYAAERLVEPRRRSERSLPSVVAEACVLVVSARRVERLMETPGLSVTSRSRVSEIARELHEAVEAFRQRPPEYADVMGGSGRLPREHSSGTRIRWGAMTRTRNSPLRLMTATRVSRWHDPRIQGAGMNALRWILAAVTTLVALGFDALHVAALLVPVMTALSVWLLRESVFLGTTGLLFCILWAAWYRHAAWAASTAS